MLFDSFSYTSKGGREYNQDYVGVSPKPSGAVYVVADGLGGHLHGELASRCAVESLLSAEPPVKDCQLDWLEEQIAQANCDVLSLPDRGNAKTTIAVLTLCENQAAWAHVGDSRVYYIHDKKIEERTDDHSVAYKKYLAGEISFEQIAFDEDQSCLLRALGNDTRNKPVCNLLDHPVSHGDGFLLCSDGAWEYLLNEEILIDFLKSDCAETWCELLLLRIAERIDGSNDNLSIITVMVLDEE